MAALGPALPASAAGPTITKDVPFSGAFDNGIACDGFGVNFAYGGERTYIDFYDSDGTLVKEIRQITYTGTLTNSVTGASIPYEGRFTRTQDFVANTIVVSGLQNRVPIPGQGVIAIDAGFVPDSGVEVGNPVGIHDFDSQVCAALG